MNLGDIVLGLASIAIGYSQIKKGVASITPKDSTNLGGTSVRKIQKGQYFTLSGAAMGKSAVEGTMKIRGVSNLDERMAAISEMAKRGKIEPSVMAWARAQVTKRCRQGRNGEQWCTPEKDTMAEIAAIYQGMRSDVRYTSDIRGFDTYVNPKHTLAQQAGDCLPGDTLLVTPSGFVRISDIKEGDTIHDGENWVKVTKWWDKGTQNVDSFLLNNGSTLVCTKGHRVFKVGKKNAVSECLAGELKKEDSLLQPRVFCAGSETVGEDLATILGAYVSEGWFDASKNVFCIAGIPDSKGVRERVLLAAKRLELDVHEHPRYLTFRSKDSGLVSGFGIGAAAKTFPTLNYDLATVKTIVGTMEMGDGGWSSNPNPSGQNMVYSTTSDTLALQYRVFCRMLGKSTHMRKLSAEEHQGAGSLPLWRITVRNSHYRRPWAVVKDVTENSACLPTFDIETESGCIYLPESDIIVHNCDDYASLGVAALNSIGIPARFKVIRTHGSQDWDHIYIQAGTPKDDPTRWVSLDASVPMQAGWEAPANMIADMRLYETE